MKNLNWVTIAGQSRIDQGSIEYVPIKFKNQLKKDEIVAGKVKSDIAFVEGEISFTAVLNEISAICQILLNYDSGNVVTIGFNSGNGLFGISKLNSKNQIENLSSTGLSQTMKVGEPYSVKIIVRGSIIDLYIDNVLVAGAYELILKSQIVLFFYSAKGISVSNISIQPKKPKAFIVMQFTTEYNDLYNEVIRPIIEDYGFECERADEVHTTNPILQDIIQSIHESSIIVADITPDNPNVFYEVGYCHALNKPTILLCDKKREKLPFDISGFRTLFYDNSIPGKSAVERAFRKYLDSITKL